MDVGYLLMSESKLNGALVPLLSLLLDLGAEGAEGRMEARLSRMVWAAA
jgi:hypothetical protein